MTQTETAARDWCNEIDPILEIDANASFFSVADESTSAPVLDDKSTSEHGRTYQSFREDAYYLPNDAQEQERLDHQHRCCLLLLDGKLALAPVNRAKNILDVATGTGIWAIEFAKQHLDAKVIGSDLSQIQPPNTAPNCSFVIQDAERGDWKYNGAFDYVHLRYTGTCFGDIAAVMRNIYDNLEPGGWVEFQEGIGHVLSTDGTSKGSSLERTSTALGRGLSMVGKDTEWVKKIGELLAVYGFVDIVERVLPLPLGTWPVDAKYKKLGDMNVPNIASAMDGCIKALLASGWSQANAQAEVAKAKAELRDPNMHAFMPFYVVYGRKPQA